MYFQEQPDDFISNLYDVKAVNKTFLSLPLSFPTQGGRRDDTRSRDSLVLQSQGAAAAKLFVLVKRDQIKTMNTPLVIEVYNGEALTNSMQTSFLGPVQKK